MVSEIKLDSKIIEFICKNIPGDIYFTDNGLTDIKTNQKHNFISLCLDEKEAKIIAGPHGIVHTISITPGLVIRLFDILMKFKELEI